MKRKLLILSVAVLALCMLFTACSGNLEAEKLTITKGLKSQYQLNETPDFTQVVASVLYNDGSTKEVSAAELSFGTIDTTTPGKKQLTISYGSLSITVEVEVVGQVYSETINDVGGKIKGTELPAWYLTAKGQRQLDKFKIKDAAYVVGNANPFELRLELTVLNDDRQMVDYTGGYVSVSAVHLIEGTTETLVGTEYVTINEEKNTFHFTAAAVGKTFRISTRPSGVQGIEEECTQSIVVTVVEGYNVTDAKELNLMTNSTDLLWEVGDWTQSSDAAGFIDANPAYGSGYYATYGGANLKGIVLHRNLSITENDIPGDYLREYPQGHPKAGQKYLDNGNFVVFAHELSAASPSFGFYGNYFQIDVKDLPYTADASIDNFGSEYSNSKIFGFSVDVKTMVTTSAEFAAYDHTAYTTTVENVAIIGRDASSNVEDASHLNALAAFNVMFHTVTMKNVSVEACNIGVVAQNDNLTLNLDSVTFYNSWMNQIYAWNNNYLQEIVSDASFNMDPLAAQKPMEINIKNSTLTKCGGPVILSQLELNSEGAIEPYNMNSGLQLTIDDASVLWSYADGTEAWFRVNGISTAATTLMALNTPLQNSAAMAGKVGSIATTNTPEGTTQSAKANIYFIATGGGKDVVTINGACVYNYRSTAVQSYFTANPLAQMGAPLLESSAGGYAAGDPSQPVLLSTTAIGQPLETSGENTDKFFSGDYMNIITYNPLMGGAVGVLMEYMH